MAKKYLDYDGLLYFWGKLKSYFVPQTRKINNQPLSADVTISVPSAGTGTSYPTMDGTRALGSNAGYARVDHVHPSDTSRVPTTRKVNGKALSADISLSASDVGALPDSTDIPTKTSDLENDSDFVSDADYVHTDSNFTAAEKTKLSGIAAGAEVNVQSDWSVTDTSSDAFIKNKPTIPTLKNVFGKVKVGTTTIEADTTQDTLELVAGSGITLTPDATNDKVTVSETTPNVIASVTDFGNYLEFVAYGAPYQAVAVGAKGSANGVAPLNANSKIDSTYLPSYVDDVIEAYPRTGATELSSTWLSTTSGGSALTPETGKIYVLMADSTSYAANSQFRWSGTTYVKLSDGGVSEITNAEIDTIVAS